MARSTPRVENGILYLLSQGQAASTIPSGSAQWYEWLELHHTFRVKSGTLTYTARSERRAGLWYWYAYRRTSGKLRIVYLGKSAELTLERLSSVAQVFSLPPAHSSRAQTPATSRSVDQAVAPEDGVAVPSYAQFRGRGNLPAALTSFVGRTHEIAEAAQLLAYSRLLTLTGPGGIGKTRLASHIASLLAERFPGGLWFVELAGISAPAQLLPTLAQALGLSPKQEQELLSAIQVALRQGPALLILDNCEHLLDACAPLVEQVLSTNPALHVLATSREMLCIPGETVLLIPPLSLPKPGEPVTLTQASRSEAVCLLLERMTPVQPSLALTGESALAVVRVCQQLEGIPLALELVAARLRLMPIEQIAQRLEQGPGARFHLLTNGKRTAAARHQTLRATIDWSYQLLSPAEQRLLRRLSLFLNGWTLEAAETVCAGDDLAPVEVLDLLGKLVHKSLVLVEEQALASEPATTHRQARYRLLETIREYSQEKLQSAGEEQEIRCRHLAYFVELARQADAYLRGPRQLSWLAWLDSEHDNLQVALCTARQVDPGAALRLASSLVFYWLIRSCFILGRKELDETLAAAVEYNNIVKAECLYRASLLTFFQGDIPCSRQMAEDSLALFKAAGDQQGIGRALSMQIEGARLVNATQQALAVGKECQALLRAGGDDWTLALVSLPLATIHMQQGHGAQALCQVEESLALMRKLGDRWGTAMLCSAVGKLHGHLGNYAQAIASFTESVDLAYAIGDRNNIAAGEHALAISLLRQQDYIGAQEQLTGVRKQYEQSGNLAGLAEALFDQGYAAIWQGDLAQATHYFERAITLYAAQGNQVRITLARYHLGRVAVLQRDIPRALNLLRESCALFQQARQHIFLAGCLEALAALSILLNVPQLGARWLGQARSFYKPTEQQRSLIPAPQAFYEKTVATLQEYLTREKFAVEFARGEAQSLEQVLREIQTLSLPEESLSRLASSIQETNHDSVADLTAREIEVLRLLATGLSNLMIAENLSISSGTVRAHLSAIYSKLAVHSRTAAVHAARAYGVL